MGNKKKKRLYYFNVRDRRYDPKGKKYNGFLDLLEDSPVLGLDLKPVDFDPFPSLSKRLDKLNKRIHKR